MDWVAKLDLETAIGNLRQEAKGDWYRDPWGWPEYDYLLNHGRALVLSRLRSMAGVRAVAAIEVPKENFGVRPAVILDLLDRVAYQLLIDRISVDLIGQLVPDVYGWRLPPINPQRGNYARQDYQWTDYRQRLSLYSGLFDYGLKTDISTFFATIAPLRLVDPLSAASSETLIVDKVVRMLSGWENQGVTGIPQRSTASSVLANLFLMSLDEVLRHSSSPMPKVFRERIPRRGFTRWMDDMWLFGDDAGKLRAAQVDIQLELRRLGLAINSGKTHLFEGDELVAEARKIGVSAIDDGLSSDSKDTRPLEELVDDVFETRENTNRSVLRLLSDRMRDHKVKYRIDELLELAEMIPHGADHLARLFRRLLRRNRFEDWLTQYSSSTWNRFEWAMAQFGTAIPSRRRPSAPVISLFEQILSSGTESVPLVAMTAQRLAAWNVPDALEIIKYRASNESSPHMLRVLSLAGRKAGATRQELRKWLGRFEENRVTLEMLADRSFRAPVVLRDFS